MEIDENAPGGVSQQGGAGTADNESGHDPKQPQAPRPEDDDVPLEEEISDVEANDSVSDEHPDP